MLAVMRASWLTRFKVVILAAVVLTGGSGLPLLDALLYHTRASQANRRDAVRWEARGAPGTHADRCTLGRAAPVPRPESGAGSTPRLIAFTFRRPAAAPLTAPRAVDPPTPLHSRAPPTLQG